MVFSIKENTLYNNYITRRLVCQGIFEGEAILRREEKVLDRMDFFCYNKIFNIYIIIYIIYNIIIIYKYIYIIY
jgi:hypothetical protein